MACSRFFFLMFFCINFLWIASLSHTVTSRTPVELITSHVSLWKLWRHAVACSHFLFWGLMHRLPLSLQHSVLDPCVDVLQSLHLERPTYLFEKTQGMLWLLLFSLSVCLHACLAFFVSLFLSFLPFFLSLSLWVSVAQHAAWRPGI